MKTTTKKLIGFALILSLLSAFPALARGPSSEANRLQTQQSVTTLSVAEQKNLLFMREEEKLARDVYIELYKTWNMNIFKNISSSEQQHMDVILKKINLFGLTDPSLPGIGIFTNPDLQELYDKLIVQGISSYNDALTVGATIEDKDILDLMNAIAATKNLALKTTYQNLLEGSKNHLRAFVGLLKNQGLKYTPQFISQELFDAILGV
ncbi:DUF2202 domain-containing protein [Methylobacter sp. S3L5C]|uniref:DUF2202 domain-containing protein n=1 Tax=Methylobacter sp. S3L5C TaxID=2839024 RepID=UPI001FAD94B1|nr:DUF2202 domain-containing protein [Methylobacter sp. S3L5C]UOA08658.1 DUF2202 domain-containing protein [Methylobacter sp. S3L5C]